MTAANENAPHGYAVEMLQVFPGQWLVEAVDHGSEGEVYRAMFDGCRAEERAVAYSRVAFGLEPRRPKEPRKPTMLRVVGGSLAALPPPAASVSPGMETLQASECTKPNGNGEGEQ